MPIEISCGYRIHVNSIDMNGFNLRVCGGIGFCLDEPRLHVGVENYDYDLVPEDLLEELMPLCAEFRLRYGRADFYRVFCHDRIHRHKGLGSSTLLKLCVLRGLHELADLPFTKSVATSFRLGLTSGIGFNAFFDGGFLVDGGYLAYSGHKTLNGEVAGHRAPILFRADFPSDWLVHVAIPNKHKSLDADDEVAFFNRITPIPNEEVHMIAYNVLMGVMPSLMEGDLDAFLKSLIAVVSCGTKRHETALHATLCQSLMTRMNADFGFVAVSSLGPSVYAISNQCIDISSYQRDFTDFIFSSSRVSCAGHRMVRIP